MPTLQGGTIAGSINLPAQSLFPTIPALYNLFKAAGASRIVWYCGMYWKRVLPTDLLFTVVHAGSSRGRGNRAAAWFEDHINDNADPEMRSLALEGGIKGWVAEKGEYLHFMQEYDETKW